MEPQAVFHLETQECLFLETLCSPAIPIQTLGIAKLTIAQCVAESWCKMTDYAVYKNHQLVAYGTTRKVAKYLRCRPREVARYAQRNNSKHEFRVVRMN